LFGRIVRITLTDVSVSIAGESYTGEGLVAETIGDLSGKPSISVNCGAIPLALGQR
jgi:DNA-binding NtrC family response regulator